MDSLLEAAPKLNPENKNQNFIRNPSRKVINFGKFFFFFTNVGNTFTNPVILLKILGGYFQTHVVLNTEFDPVPHLETEE